MTLSHRTKPDLLWSIIPLAQYLHSVGPPWKQGGELLAWDQVPPSGIPWSPDGKQEHRQPFPELSTGTVVLVCCDVCGS